MQFVSKVYNAVVDTASQAFSVVGTKSKAAVSRLPSLTLQNAAKSIVGLATVAALLFLILKLLSYRRLPHILPRQQTPDPVQVDNLLVLL